MILYKCHLFGVNPPALTSSVAAATSKHHQQQQQTTLAGDIGRPLHHSSASWPPIANDFFNLIQLNAINQQQQQSVQVAGSSRRQSDCSLCLNIDRKFQCSWCSNQCKYTDHCQELAASTCPPPRIDSVSISISGQCSCSGTLG